MTVSQPQVYCPNLTCSAPLNSFGSLVCDQCQTPLIYRYLWVVGEAVLTIPVGSVVAGRYYVKASQVWLDTQPALLPDFPSTELPDDLQAYLHLCPHRLHIPEIYGICVPDALSHPAAQVSDTVPQDGPIAESQPVADGLPAAQSVMLLENAPLDDKGNLYPAIAQAWSSASAVRQLYWLSQLLELWQPLAQQGAKASLLVADNLRVEGWRVRLCQLFWDEGILASATTTAETVQPLSLADLALLWLGWVDQAQPTIADELRHLCYEMRADQVDIDAIAAQLNQLLLKQVAQLPLRLTVASKTDTGPQHDHNEDSAYPPALMRPDESAVPQLAMVCDGIGGHEGGEIASQMAVQSLKLQVQALIKEMAEQTEPQSPRVISEQLVAAVRVINDLISHQNDTQGREARRRMGTTLIMGVQLPQRVTVAEAAIAENSHELYLVNVGDSRAYWITPRYCHLLTLDDDVAVRETRMGRMIYREALQRADAGSLIQALGTRNSEFLYPTVQRFVLEEDGVLLLCSDGLSDNGLVETGWLDIMPDVFRGKRSLDWAADQWIQRANQKNGHDNVTVVLLQCHVSSPMPAVQMPPTATGATGSDWSEASRALLQSDAVPASAQESPPQATFEPQRTRWLWIFLLASLVLIGGGAVWWQTHTSQPSQPEQPTQSPTGS